MGGYIGFDEIKVGYSRPHTVISDSIRKEFEDMEPERKDRVIKLLQAKVRMLEQSIIGEQHRYEYEQAEEDRKFFLNYRSAEVEKTDDELDRENRIRMAQNLGLACDENGYLLTVDVKDTVVAVKDLPPDGYEMLDMNPVEERPGKVTLGPQIHPLPLGKDGPEELHIIVDKRYYEISMPKVDETETHLLIKAKKRG